MKANSVFMKKKQAPSEYKCYNYDYSVLLLSKILKTIYKLERDCLIYKLDFSNNYLLYQIETKDNNYYYRSFFDIPQHKQNSYISKFDLVLDQYLMYGEEIFLNSESIEKIKNDQTNSNESIHYYSNNKLHREDGPAIENYNKEYHYYIDNKRHRIDGPAIEYPNGHKRYYLDNKEYSYEDWLKYRNLIVFL